MSAKKIGIIIILLLGTGLLGIFLLLFLPDDSDIQLGGAESEIPLPDVEFSSVLSEDFEISTPSPDIQAGGVGSEFSPADIEPPSILDLADELNDLK